MRTKQSTSRDIPLFAQPLNGAHGRDRQASPAESTMNLVWTGVSLGVAMVFLAFAVPNSAQNRPNPQTKSGKETPQKDASATVATKSATGDTKGQTVVDSSARRPIDFYTRNVRDTMFSAPQPPAPPKPKPLPPPPAPKPAPPVHVPVVEINPFEDWAYTGTVKMGDQMMALLENTKTKEGQYLHSGDSFMGAQVSQITDQMVTLTAGGKPHLLAKSDTITLTPLDKSAAYLGNGGGAPGGPPPGMPGQPPMPGGMPPGMTPPGMVTLPNGRALTPTQAVRRSRRLNRQFNAP